MSNKRIVLLDGAVGTSLWEKATAKGEENVAVWRYNIEDPDIVRELASDYIDAGARIILANTFGANRSAVSNTLYHVPDIVKAGVKLAKEAAAGTDVKVALSAGPLSQLLEPYGYLTEAEAREIYEEQIGSGMDEHPDLILLQTFMDVEMMRVAVSVAKQYNVPVFCAMTFEKVGKTMMGNSVSDILNTLEPLGIDAIGMNCSLGPDLALPIIREFSEKTELTLIFKPNAGKPILAADGKTQVPYTAEHFAKETEPALDFVKYVGGCCGSNPSYIRTLKPLVDARNKNLL